MTSAEKAGTFCLKFGVTTAVEVEGDSWLQTGISEDDTAAEGMKVTSTECKAMPKVDKTHHLFTTVSLSGGNKASEGFRWSIRHIGVTTAMQP